MQNVYTHIYNQPSIKLEEALLHNEEVPKLKFAGYYRASRNIVYLLVFLTRLCKEYSKKIFKAQKRI